MVIDKWTRLSTSNNNSLNIPLLGHKSKETFSELKQGYERLKFMNHKINKWRHPSIPKGQNSLKINEITDIKEYLEQINLTLISIDELLSENYNFDQGDQKAYNANEKNNIYNGINFQCEIFKENIIHINRNIKNDNEIDSNLIKSQNLINNIYEKLKKFKFIGNSTSELEQHNLNILNIKPNIDRGQINIFSRKREFNNSITIEKNDYQFSVEEESLINIIRLQLLLFIFCFLFFIFYIFIH